MKIALQHGILSYTKEDPNIAWAWICMQPYSIPNEKKENRNKVKVSNLDLHFYQISVAHSKMSSSQTC